MSKRPVAIAVVVAIFGLAGHATGQPRQLPSAQRVQVFRSVGGWVAAGAAGGFGLGLIAGMGAFDEAINSDQEIWTSAIAGAAIGATAGYLVGRARRSKGQSASLSNGFTFERAEPIPPAVMAQVVKSVRLQSRRLAEPAHAEPLWTPFEDGPSSRRF